MDTWSLSGYGIPPQFGGSFVHEVDGPWSHEDAPERLLPS